MATLTTPQPKPFLKWAGGKGQLIPQIETFLPKELNISGRITKYFEPFLGGGAVFFWVTNLYEFEEVYLYEANHAIGMCYRTVKENAIRLVKELRDLEEEYFSLSDTSRETFFYDRREEYNSLFRLKSKNKVVRRSALLIFLNKTCFNGLYRVNSQGEFNVPFCRYKNPTICDKENLYAVSRALQNAQIVYGDFELCLEHVDSRSFVYFDPPYRPISKTANFNSYAKDTFDDDEQRRLKKVFDKLDKRDAFVMLSNSDPKNIDPNDNFFDDLYKGYPIERLKATRMINCNADKRGEIKEILVMNYQNKGSFRADTHNRFAARSNPIHHRLVLPPTR